MKKNLHSIDRIIRLLSLVIVSILFSQGIIAGTLGYVLLAVTGILALTSVVSFCPIYKIFGISTCAVNTKGTR